MLKTVLRIAVFGISICLAGFITPVAAYPPGTALTATLVPDVIAVKTGKAALSVKNANPKEKLVVQIGKKSSSVSQTGTYKKTITGQVAGVYKVVTTSPVSPNDDPEVKTLTLYVPGVTAPKSGSIKAKTTIKLKYLKPGSVVTLLPKAGKKSKKLITVKVGKKATAANVVIPAKTFVKGSTNTFKLTISKTVVITYKFTGK